MLEEHSRRTDEQFAQIDRRFDRMDEKLDDIARQMNILIETKVMPQFNLLAENQQIMLEKLAPVSRVEALEDEVKFLKVVIRQMNEDIQELKQAN